MTARRGVFVTGTDTEIGKTVFCRELCARHVQAVYWKPIQTGFPADDDTATVAARTALPGLRYRDPVSPHLAAAREGATITLERVLAPLASAPDDLDDRPLIVEGAGGALVPLGPDLMQTDLMVALELPVVVVARNRLGTINHTLLTVQALRARGLTVRGVALWGESDLDNREAIQRFGDVAVFAEPLCL